ncbi:hypothetical protein GGI18_005117, partial [Coemansia linderi]
MGNLEYPCDEKKALTYLNEKKVHQPFQEKSFPMGFDTYASTGHTLPSKLSVASPEPKADVPFYPIDRSNFALRKKSVDSIYDDLPHETREYRGRPDGQSGEMDEKRGGGDKDEPQTIPYVGRWAQMSRAWATQTIIMMIITAFSYFLLSKDVEDMAKDAILQLTSACLTLESATNTVINSPRSVAITTVTMVEKTAQSIIDLTGRSFLKIISVLQNLIGWILRLYLGTYICIAEVIIRTAVSIATDV